MCITDYKPNILVCIYDKYHSCVSTETPTGHNDAPPASPKASSMPPWLIVVTAASVIIAGMDNLWFTLLNL